MNLSHRIQAKTDNGDTVIDFLIEVMQDLPRTRNGSLPRTRNGDDRDGFKMCHRLGAARLLTRYGCSCKSAVAERDDAIDFIIDNPPEPSGPRPDSGSPTESTFDIALAKKIKESTDDGASVVRFLINVMEGELKAFGPHHSMAAARELLSRGFGKHAREEAHASNLLPPSSSSAPQPSFPRKRESTPGSDRPADNFHSSGSAPTAVTTAEIDGNTQHQAEDEDDEGWEAFWEEMAPIIERDDRLKAELAEQEPDPDNPPHVPDLSAFHEAWENSEKWFQEWKNSIDPEEYEAIIAEELAGFHTMIDTQLERRKQIAADRERREREEAERLAQQSAVADEAEAESEEPPGPRPPTRSQHRRKLMFVLGDSIYVDCDHPDCDLHEQDRSRFRGSVQYGAGPTSGHFP